jgi:hypothetical protein
VCSQFAISKKGGEGVEPKTEENDNIVFFCTLHRFAVVLFALLSFALLSLVLCLCCFALICPAWFA